MAQSGSEALIFETFFGGVDGDDISCIRFTVADDYRRVRPDIHFKMHSYFEGVVWLIEEDCGILDDVNRFPVDKGDDPFRVTRAWTSTSSNHFYVVFSSYGKKYLCFVVPFLSP